MSSSSSSAPICYVNMQALNNNFPALTEGQFIGWTEKDGIEGFSNPDEEVFLGDALEDGVVLHVNCNNWYVIFYGTS